MPQVIVDMKIKALTNIGGKLKVNSFKLRHAPYSDRYKTMPPKKLI